MTTLICPIPYSVPPITGSEVSTRKTVRLYPTEGADGRIWKVNAIQIRLIWTMRYDGSDHLVQSLWRQSWTHMELHMHMTMRTDEEGEKGESRGTKPRKTKLWSKRIKKTRSQFWCFRAQSGNGTEKPRNTLGLFESSLMSCGNWMGHVPDHVNG